MVPKISVGKAPTAVIQNLLKDRSWKKTAALKLLRLRSQHDPDLGRTVTEVSGAYHRSSEAQEVFHLLAYARKYWLVHTRTISAESLTFSLWSDLLTHPTFAQELRKASRQSPHALSNIRADSRVNHPRHDGFGRRNAISSSMLAQFSPTRHWTDIHNPQARFILCEFHPEIIWAITNSHLGLLSFELKGQRRLKTLCGIVAFLLTLQKTNVWPLLDRLMWDKLGQLASALGMKGLADDMSQLYCEGKGRMTEQYALDQLHRVERRTYLLQRHIRSSRPGSEISFLDPRWMPMPPYGSEYFSESESNDLFQWSEFQTTGISHSRRQTGPNWNRLVIPIKYARWATNKGDKKMISAGNLKYMNFWTVRGRCLFGHGYW